MYKFGLLAVMIAAIMGCSSFPNNSLFPNDVNQHSYDKSLYYVGDAQTIMINGKLEYVLTHLAYETNKKWQTLSGKTVFIVKRDQRNSLVISAYPNFEFKMDYEFEGDKLTRRLFINDPDNLSIQDKRDVYAIASRIDEAVNTRLDIQIRETSQ